MSTSSRAKCVPALVRDCEGELSMPKANAGLNWKRAVYLMTAGCPGDWLEMKVSVSLEILLWICFSRGMFLGSCSAASAYALRSADARNGASLNERKT